MLNVIKKYFKNRNNEFRKLSKKLNKFVLLLVLLLVLFPYSAIWLIFWYICPFKVKSDDIMPEDEAKKEEANALKTQRHASKRQNRNKKPILEKQKEIYQANIEIDETIFEKEREEEEKLLQNEEYFIEKLIKFLIIPFVQNNDIEAAIKAFIGYTNFNYNEIISIILNIETDSLFCTETQIKNIINDGFAKEPDLIINVEKVLEPKTNDYMCELTFSLESLIVTKLNYDTVEPFENENFINKNGNFKLSELQAAINEHAERLTKIKASELYGNLDEKIKALFTEGFAVNIIMRDFEFCQEYHKFLLETLETYKEQYQTCLNDYIALRKEFIQFELFLKRASELLKDKIVIAKENSVENFYQKLLMLSVYLILWQKEININYSPENKSLVVDYALPLIENLLVAKDDGKTLNDRDRNNLYSNVIYQICLRTINEVFTHDENDCIDFITFNGIVTAIDKATGKNKTAYIISLQVNKEKFAEIELANVDPKECFKYLNGVGAVELSSITPINPIRKINTTDKRFVDAYEMLDNINSGTNLAIMDWKDFENLIREVFEKEFSNNGGEVKITQASRDGGVDAIAFDPDPIKGGKIIIQAKRYTNIVGVSAVRDLYGTILNEGANSGILVTTSDYGADSYEFASDKPIKLMNGAELLGLLQKHNYNAYINLEKAKSYLKKQ